MEWVVLGFIAVIVLIVAITMLRMLRLYRSQPGGDGSGPWWQPGDGGSQRDHSSADRPSRPAAVRARIDGGFAARSYQVRRASCGAAPPASGLLRTAHPRGGLRPVLTPEPLRPLRAERAGRSTAPLCGAGGYAGKISAALGGCRRVRGQD